MCRDHLCNVGSKVNLPYSSCSMLRVIASVSRVLEDVQVGGALAVGLKVGRSHLVGSVNGQIQYLLALTRGATTRASLKISNRRPRFTWEGKDCCRIFR